MLDLDRQVFDWINRWPDEWAPFFRFLSIGIKGLGLKIVFGVLAVGLLIWPKTRLATILALLSWPLANGITDLLKSFVPMLRPSVDLASAIVRVEPLSSAGTASAHSANMAAVAMAFALNLGSWRGQDVRLRLIIAFWVLVAFLTGLSRIYVGVHYPYQVVLGWVVGCFAAWLVTLLGRVAVAKFQKPGSDG
ncbi:MAG: phosphatase PAP2 family protein [Fimbriimonadaceae bacterium]|nr:phosphatase PAP2 family protein [Fimbriimonadaceae bacterium]